MKRDSDRCGIFSWFGFELPLAERLKLIKEAGFESTSVWMGIEEKLVREKKQNSIPEMVREHGLFFENIHAPFKDCNKIWSDDFDVRRDAKNQYISLISFCSTHKIPVIVIHISKGDDAPECNQYGIGVIKELVKRAEELGVIIAIENTRKFHYLDYIYSDINSPALAFCYDSSHDSIWSDNPGEILSKWGHLLVVTHFSDNDGELDSHWIPGEGIINWKIVADCFPKNYKGLFTLEVVPDKDTSKGARAFLKKALAGLITVKSLLTSP